MSNSFKFKQFTIQQGKSAMKIGTDGVLLGAWTSLQNSPTTILDIGTGTGIIALQLAQRSISDTIDGLEIDANAYEQAVENFEDSPWGDRLFCYHASLEEFVKEMDETYDLIVSNPPFYNDNFESDNAERNKARFTSSLSFKELILSVSKLLSYNGAFSVIIPFKEEVNFLALARKEKLYPARVCRIRGNQASEIKRSLLELSFQESNTQITALTIENSRHNYTEDYQKLVKDFYLNM